MNILLLGNGFDLAHGLPTKYTDFLEFVKMIKIIKEKNIFNDGFAISDAGCNVDNRKLNQDIRLSILNKANNNRLEGDSKELLECINDNIWIEYFLHCDNFLKQNWIDFENEISKVIKSVDADMKGNIEGKVSYEKLSNEYLKNCFMTYDDLFERIDGAEEDATRKSFRELRDKLLDDLNRLIRALEIYLTQYVEKIDCKLVSPDIQMILSKDIMKIGGMPEYNTYVLSFNYTNTYQRLYIEKIQEKRYFEKYFERYIDYIHGKANINNTIETNNMVLGIDEYLSKKRKDKEVDFIAFKKFYQRIHKGTGCKYKEWTDIIKEEFSDYQIELEKSKTEKDIMTLKEKVNKLKMQYLNKHHVYIFGHSLDVTDKDILKDLILNDNVHVTIFYHDKEAMRQQIANLVKVIGQDELIRRTGGSTKTIEFKPQQDMVPIEK